MMSEALEAVKKYGVTGVFAVALVWFNNRLNTVEERLYDCYETLYTSYEPMRTDKDYTEPDRSYAVLPSEIKIKRC